MTSKISQALICWRRPPVDFYRKPPYYPKPKPTLKPKAMTIGIGLLPLNEKAVILATDTKYTSHVTYQGEKVLPLTPRNNFRVVLAGASNDANFMQVVAADIDRSLPQNSQSVTFGEIKQIIKEGTELFYKRRVLPLVKAKVADYNVPEYEFLIAVWCARNQLALLKLYKGETSEVAAYDFVGTGAVIARAYGKVGRSRVDTFDAGLLALYWARMAKRGDPDSGGPTSLYILDEAGELKHALPVYLECAEHQFDEVEGLFNSILIPLSLGDEDMLQDVLNENLRGEVSEMKRLRRDLVLMYNQHAWCEQVWPPAAI